MNIMSCEQIKHKDTMAMLKYGIPGVLLMERAAMAVYREMEQRALLKGKIVVICGCGNNGGDGYALAGLLYQNQCNVTVVNLFDIPPKTADAAVFYQILNHLEVPFGNSDEIESADVIVDAIFGIGLKRELNDFLKEIVERINRSSAVKICVDLPSGMDGDECFQKNRTVNADVTVTFTAFKPGLLFYPSAYSAGETVLAEIGIPKGVGDDLLTVITKSRANKFLPKRDCTGHKNSFGSVLVVGGSNGMTGAPVLSSRAALVSGCGLVTTAVPKSLHPVVASQLTEIMSVPLEDNHRGCFDQEGREELIERAQKADCVLFGPGAGTGSGAEALLHVLLQSKKKLVIDADGLNILSARMDWLMNRENEMCILTPHPGEMSRLTGVPVAEIEENRMEFAKNFACRYKVTLVLKGARTVVATPDGRVFVNVFGNSGMATAGSGDVLAGIISSLVAQSATEEEAAVCGVAIHSIAGDKAKENLGEYGMVSGDLVKFIPMAMKEISEV